ncbi:hypothetical protein ABZ804_18080 [Streptomyces sp. NPDC047726]|uniref:hypothetical protein n=1 Tax=unclassified Streptomyces TaxID=2593676 RepID=UPI0033CEAF37
MGSISSKSRATAVSLSVAVIFWLPAVIVMGVPSFAVVSVLAGEEAADEGVAALGDVWSPDSAGALEEQPARVRAVAVPVMRARIFFMGLLDLRPGGRGSLCWKVL